MARSASPGSEPSLALVAGEASGDLLAGLLLAGMRARWPAATSGGIGGPQMAKQGFDAWWPHHKLAVHGFSWELLRRYREIVGIRAALGDRLLADKPDVFIGVDAPDFNLDLEASLKASGIRTVHFVSPSVWAWRHKRIFKIAAATNMVLSLLPFEKAFYDKYQVPCTFVGHTMADTMPLDVDKAAAKAELGLQPDKLVLAIMPGSRTNEIKLLAGDFLQAAVLLQQQFPDIQFVTNMVTSAKAAQFNAIKQQIAPQLNITEFTGQARQVLLASDATFITSGTATLEAMLAKCLMVVSYRANWLTYQIGKRLVKLAHFSLPNLLAGRGMVTELLQHQVTPQALVNAMVPLLSSERATLLQQYRVIHQSIKCNASTKAAEAILQVSK